VRPARNLLHRLTQFRIGKLRSILFVTLVTFGVVGSPLIASAQQLNLSWVDNSGGQSAFLIQRATGSTGAFASIAQTANGATSYSDTGLSFGTTYCYQVAAFNAAGTSSFTSPACGSPSGGFTLDTSKTGSGTGTVTSSPAGINCGTACSYTYSAGTAVTLAAAPSSGSAFNGWSNGGCSGTVPCTLAGNGTVTVTANFATSSSYTLTVSKQGPGTVSSDSGGISCGSVCAAAYSSGASVTLTAIPGRGAKFIGWGGAGCSGSGSCTVTVSAATFVTARFSKNGH